MTRAHLLTAAVLIACGCSEPSSGPRYSPVGPPAEPLVITGTVTTDGSVSPVVSLRLESGEMVDIVGSEAQRLAALGGADVQLRGTWTGAIMPPFDTDVTLDSVRRAFSVAEFLVLAVGGRSAMDGVLEEEEGRYYLRLSAGDVFWFEDAPSDFTDCIGKRIWVTGSMEDPPLTFGVIN